MALAAEALALRSKPPLKWAGGKRWLVPELRRYWSGQEHRRLVEPFVGGLAVTLGLMPSKALLNDANPHLISFYRWLKQGLDPASVGITLKNDRDVFDANRARFNTLIASGQAESSEAAVLFYYLNRTGFNGLCRFNSRGFFNVPFGRYGTILYRDMKDLAEYRNALSKFEFRCGDFENISIKKPDFVYADPPYDTPFTQYFAGGFCWDDQVRLARWLAKHRGPVVASNQATERILKLYRNLGFVVQTLSAPRRISCDGNRDDAREMIATLNL